MKKLKKYWTISFLIFTTTAVLRTNSAQGQNIHIYFSEFGVEILSIPKLGDTIGYNKSSKEDFKFVFTNRKGECYCEKFVNKTLSQSGYFVNSLDTLKRYVSGRYIDGNRTKITVQEYFEPLKNGVWITFKNGKQIKEIFNYGVKEPVKAP